MRKTSPSSRDHRFDWAEIRHRLEVSLQSGGSPGGEGKVKEILHARARALSQESAQVRRDEEAAEFVEFTLAAERYGVETPFVREVYPLRDLTPLPGAPSFVLGIINVRGEILSVIDLKTFFDLPHHGLTDLNKAIVLHSPAMEFAILADTILGVNTISPRDLRPALPTLTGIREEYLKGLTPDGTVLLDAGRLLDDHRMVIRDAPE
ncbi:MAG: hypothetical protein HBSIN02_06460 [Bacteroidia bacterium]|nr:MAG: hypothetical protein HBSIN02_06460 [Bacteroidia bacterium]